MFLIDCCSCNTAREAQDLIDYKIALLADEAAEATCSSVPPPFPCVQAAATGLAVGVIAVALDGCALHDGKSFSVAAVVSYQHPDESPPIVPTFSFVFCFMVGLVDSAEIEATYENLLRFIDQVGTDFQAVNTNIADQGTAITTALTSEGEATRNAVASDGASTRMALSQESSKIQEAVAQGVKEIQDLINSQFELLNDRLDIVDETLRIVRRTQLTPVASRPGYDDKDTRCECTVPTPGIRLGFLNQYCDNSKNCPMPTVFP